MNDKVMIHGNEYITVAGRLKLAREDLVSIDTEVVPNGGAVIIKATVVTKKGSFTGISAANPSKAIEKASPYEVAETSAVGRALGFAGYGAVDGIATAEEMKKADSSNPDTWEETHSSDTEAVEVDAISVGPAHHCEIHDKQLKDRGQGIWDHRAKLNPDTKRYEENGMWHYCTGKGWHLSVTQG